MPGVVVAAAANVTVLEAEAAPLRLVGEKDAVTPVGRPDADKAIEAKAPFETALETVIWFELPVSTVSEVALAVNVRLGVGITSDTVTLSVTPLLTALTVAL